MINEFIKQINTDRLRDYYLSIGQGAIDLLVNIIAILINNNKNQLIRR